MKKNFLGIVCSVSIIVCLIVHYGSKALISRTGVRLLLPVTVESVKKDSFSFIAEIRYENFIPVEELKSDTGVLVVQRSDDGRVAFGGKFEGQKLRPSEILLKYSIRQSFSPVKNDARPDIRFAASRLRFFSEKISRLSAIRYAVVYVDKNGNTSLAELTDGTGVSLIRGIGFP